MFMKISNLTFIMFLMWSSILIISSSNWLFGWLCLEINLMSLVPLLMYKIKFKNSSSSIKYFTIQAMASILLFMGIMWMMTKFNSNTITNKMDFIVISLAIKLGMPPFQFWVPQVIEMINMIKILLVLVWQKIAPMVLMCYNTSNMLLLMVILSATLGALGGMNQNNLKKIFFYSSLIHLSWMILILKMNEKVWLMYFASYCLILAPTAIWCYYKKMTKINNINMNEMNSYQKLLILTSILSLAGLPPFLGFLIKIMSIQFMMMHNQMIYLGLFLISSSLISIFYYFKLMWMMYITTYSKNKFFTSMSLMKKKMLFLTTLILNIVAPLMVFLA